MFNYFVVCSIGWGQMANVFVTLSDKVVDFDGVKVLSEGCKQALKTENFVIINFICLGGDKKHE